METSFTEIQIEFLKSKGFTKKSDNIFEYCENDRFSTTGLFLGMGNILSRLNILNLMRMKIVIF